MNYEAVIGLEIHAQLATDSKMFCSCSTFFGQDPNSNICPICTSQPGVLPTLNKKALQYAIKTALSLNCSINKNSVFSRKNYFYPDLPKGYQISQYDEPLAVDGFLDIDLKQGASKKIGVTRVHMEEDAGKNIHAKGSSLVDLNRAGVPLIEIVSEPDMRTAEEASAYFKKLRTTLSYIEVCNCNMEEGNLRCDVNVSVRKMGDKKLGTKVEIKNVNSFKFVEKAINYEIKRQIDLIDSGGFVIQDTRSYDPSTDTTKSMRQKEEANDYRYFPEPDLRPVEISDELIKTVLETMPELPDNKRKRFMYSYGLSFYDADVLSSDRAIADYYERLVSVTKEAKISSNWMQTQVLRLLNEKKCAISEISISPETLGELLKFVISKAINQNTAKEVFDKMISSGESPSSIIDKEGLAQISDTKLIEKTVDEVLLEFSDQLAQYRAGKTNVLGFLIGQVMKKTKGRANPAMVNELLIKKMS